MQSFIDVASRLAADMQPAGDGAITVGVTGHRWNRIDPEERPALAATLAALFAAIGSQRPATRFALATGMAEGADLLAAAARPAGWHLRALMPFPEARWRAHLLRHASGDPAAAVAELDAQLRGPGIDVAVLPPAGDGGPDYVGLALRLAVESDAVIAVWNGEPALPGGTGDVVGHALAAGKPVIRVWKDIRWFARRHR